MKCVILTASAFLAGSILVGSAVAQRRDDPPPERNGRPGGPPRADGRGPGRPEGGRQDAGRPEGRDGEGRPPGPPPGNAVLDLFDANGDGEISAAEIDNAASVLKRLDRNGDGRLTRDELPRPPRPGDAGGPGGPNGPGGPRERPAPPGEARSNENAKPGQVLFSGGYDTDPVDHGRPVVLIASALGVKSEVFRDAFSNVRPARGGGPTAEQARANKKVLMDALGKYGITNDRLDEVSNFYRYNAAAGEVWRRTPASATAIIKDGKVTGFTITNAGAGYTTPPKVTVAGYGDVQVKAALEFTKDFATNGRVSSLTIVER